MKVCSKCKIEKNSEDYPKVGNRCKSCLKEYRKKYKIDNKEKLKENSKIYYLETKEHQLEKRKVYYDNNKEHYKMYREENKKKLSEYHKLWREENKEYLFEYGKEWREENKEKIINYKKEYYENNKEEISIKNKEYYIENKDRINNNKSYYQKLYKDKNKDRIKIRDKKYRSENRERSNNYIKERLKTDKLFKLTRSIRSIIKISFRYKGLRKNSKTSIILGCSFKEFKLYIENSFEDWMTWDNYGKYNGEVNYGWDIDHITPLSSALTEDDVIKLNHYTNLQPLCSYINRVIKRDNY